MIDQTNITDKEIEEAFKLGVDPDDLDAFAKTNDELFDIINFTVIGKLQSLELFIIDRRFDPFPDIKIQVLIFFTIVVSQKF